MPQFLEFAFTELHALIDWSRGYESLDKELQQVLRDAELGKRIADKLFRVWLQDGEEAWVLIHVEVQSQEESGFAERMYVYNYRCFDRYRKPVISLAVLGDERASWRPSSFGYAYDGFRLSLEFPIVKLVDYEAQWEVLEQSTNPFAVMVMAHLKTKAKTGKPQERKQWKWSLIRRLFERGYNREQVVPLFQFIDWMMALPVELQRELRQELKRYQEESQMPLISRMELMAKEEGREEGIVRNARDSVIEILQARFQVAPPAIVEAVNSISDVARLKQLLRQAIAVASVEEFQQLLAQSGEVG
ncbi:Rpn family recombination-promoting nuclease/putative transposase [Kamptonema formosum]|uniref:Rpn family recombination-promoting nuclease/putative transposase n=1 Tax=Kamptonema formosum TaxID=331992 RepID=UPI00034DCA08|nr:Rpn family recombination-promoting nuclease/putative transposase [Oscillatoria sp. PCC 10802]